MEPFDDEGVEAEEEVFETPKPRREIPGYASFLTPSPDQKEWMRIAQTRLQSPNAHPFDLSTLSETLRTDPFFASLALTVDLDPSLTQEENDNRYLMALADRMLDDVVRYVDYVFQLLERHRHYREGDRNFDAVAQLIGTIMLRIQEFRRIRRDPGEEDPTTSADKLFGDLRIAVKAYEVQRIDIELESERERSVERRSTFGLVLKAEENGVAVALEGILDAVREYEEKYSSVMLWRQTLE